MAAENLLEVCANQRTARPPGGIRHVRDRRREYVSEICFANRAIRLIPARWHGRPFDRLGTRRSSSIALADATLLGIFERCRGPPRVNELVLGSRSDAIRQPSQSSGIALRIFCGSLMHSTEWIEEAS